MKNLYIKTMILILAGLLFAGQGFAAITAEQAARLGNDLTPLGGEKAGNANGTIPAWDGGITSPPAGYQKGMHHPDPYAADKVLFTERRLRPLRLMKDGATQMAAFHELRHSIPAAISNRDGPNAGT